MFNILGVIEPTKEKKNPKKKRESNNINKYLNTKNQHIFKSVVQKNAPNK
jgi:hypothetical protein